MLDKPSPATDTWTEERIAILTRMWVKEGASAGEIATALGGDPITRHSVIGKAKRLNLQQGRRSPALPPKQNGNRGVAKSNAVVHRVFTRRAARPPEFVPDDGVDFTSRLGLMDVGAHACKWIDGDPKTPNHTFCGKRAKPGTSWCSTHYARVYTPR